MGRIPKTEKFKAPNTADNDMIYDEIIEFRLPSQLVNEGMISFCLNLTDFRNFEMIFTLFSYV